MGDIMSHEIDLNKYQKRTDFFLILPPPSATQSTPHKGEKLVQTKKLAPLAGAVMSLRMTEG